MADLLDALLEGRPPSAPPENVQAVQQAVAPADTPSWSAISIAQRMQPAIRPENAARVDAALADIGGGIVEAPSQIAGGVMDALNQGMAAADSAGRALEELIGIDLPGIYISPTGEQSIASGAELDALREAGMMAQLPTTHAPRTGTGGFIRAASQFMLPFSMASKALAGLGIAGGFAATTGNVALSGAIAQGLFFDPHEQRFGNMLETLSPSLRDSVLTATAAREDDTEWEGRLKAAAEGAGFGLVSELLVGSVRALRAVTQARRATPIPRIEMPPRTSILGDPSRPLVRITRAADDVLAAADDAARSADDVLRAAGDDPVFINYARIDTPDDIHTIIGRMAELDAPGITAAQRGVQSWEQTRALAADLGMSVDDLVTRRAGAPFNAEEAYAARQLWASAATRLREVATEAATNPSDANLYAFRRMMSVYTGIQREVIGARTETARALASWRMPAGTDAEATAAIERTLSAFGGTGVTRDLARAISEASLTPAQLAHMAEGGIGVRTYRALHELWINGLLSQPATHVVNTVSNFSVAHLSIFERGVAARIGRLLGDNESVAMGEATAQLHSMVTGFRDGLRAAFGGVDDAMTKMDTPYQNAITGQAILGATGATRHPWIARAIDGIGAIVRTPGRLLEGGDRFFKAMGYRMEAASQAVRMATREVQAGTLPREAFQRRVAELMIHPPESIRMAATVEAYYRTFQQAAGPKTMAILNLRNRIPGLGFILPFVRTPSNILHYTLSRTPLAPLLGQFRADIAAGGATRDLALSRMAVGTGAMLTAMDLSLQGHVSGGGPGDYAQVEALRRTGWQPYSVNIGGQWIAYNRLDPVGALMGFGADFSEMFMNGGVPGQTNDQQSTFAAALASVANVFMNKTYLTGLADLVTAIQEPERRAEGWLRRFAGSFIPAGVAGFARMQDPYLRDAQTMIDQLRSRTPGLSEALPAQLDLWGRPIGFRSEMGAIYDWISPLRVSEDNPEPIDTEMLRLEYTPLRPQSDVTIRNVRLDLSEEPGVYQTYVRLAGAPALEMLNAVVSGNHELSGAYARMNDDMRMSFIQNVVNNFRQRAKEELLATDDWVRMNVLAGMQGRVQ